MEQFTVFVHQAPFDKLIGITRLGALGLSALINPTLRADAIGIPLGRTTALVT